MTIQTATAHAIEVVLPHRVEPDGLVVRAATPAPPQPGQVTLRMVATGVSFAEQQMRKGKYVDQPRFPFVPGYDVVGTVEAVGAGVDASLLGRRVAAVTKIGAWATLVTVPASDLLEVPDDLDATVVEPVLVNGITAWQMLHDVARVRSGSTIVVLGANGGVGSLLVQLAAHAGMRVIGTASTAHHDAVRAMGAEVVDRTADDLHDRIAALAPGGVDAVFDHVGGAALADSWRLLARGGVLVSYGTASTKDVPGNAQLPIVASILRLTAWSLRPGGRRGRFYNLWAGRRSRARYVARQQRALSSVLELVRAGVVRPSVAARVPLSRIAHAVELAESGTVTGKVVVVPDA